MQMKELLELAKNAGVKKGDFSKPKFFYAWIYREVICCMISVFSKSKHNIVNSEYSLTGHGGIKEITIVLELYKEKIQNLGVFLAKNIELIPHELRQKFNMCIGNSDDKNGGIIVSKEGVRLVSQSGFDEEDTDGSLTDEIKNKETYAKLGILRKKMHKIIMQ